jgi:hypothetical protein
LQQDQSLFRLKVKGRPDLTRLKRLLFTHGGLQQNREGGYQPRLNSDRFARLRPTRGSGPRDGPTPTSPRVSCPVRSSFINT